MLVPPVPRGGATLAPAPFASATFPPWTTTSAPASLLPSVTPAARELLDVLNRSDADRAALIGRLYARADARWLAELLIDIDIDSDDITRMHIAYGCGEC
jgi:hypothetical protein